MARVLHYCQLCREEEIRRYGTTVGMLPNNTVADMYAQHDRACYDAGCEHPAYSYDRDLTPERYEEIRKEIEEALGPDDGPQDDY